MLVFLSRIVGILSRIVVFLKVGLLVFLSRIVGIFKSYCCYF